MQVFDTVGSQNAGAAAIGNDGQASAQSTGAGRQDLGRREQLAEGFDAHGAGPFERSVEHAVRPDERTGVR